MPHQQFLDQNIQLTLLFQTVPSATTLDVSLSLPSDTHWHILRRADGVYLQRYQKCGPQVFHQLGSFPDPAIAPHKHLSIKTRLNGFIVYLHNGNLVTYSSDGEAYAALTGARDFLSPGEHHFKCGSLEFLLSFQQTP